MTVNDYRVKVLTIIENYDKDGGATFDIILGAIEEINEDELEQIIIDLLREGLIYEPEIFRYKVT